MKLYKGLPAPVAFTLGDKLRLLTSTLILVMGIVLLWRTLPIAFTPQAVLVGAAFVGFGVYRLWLAATRLRQWKSGK
jgi:hypothetical protein